MPRYLKYSYKQDQLVMLNPEGELEVGTLEHAIHPIIEKRIDGSLFMGDYRNEETGRPAYDPKILLNPNDANEFFKREFLIYQLLEDWEFLIIDYEFLISDHESGISNLVNSQFGD